MKDLLRPHWLFGTTLAVGGGLAFRFGPRLMAPGTGLVALRLMGLLGVTLGLFLIARGVSRRAQERQQDE